MGKAGRKKRDWLQNIQEGKMRDIAKIFFLTFITKSQTTKVLYKNRIKKREELTKRKNLSSIGYVAPEITKRVKEWEKSGFLEKSRIKIRSLDKTIKGTHTEGKQEVIKVTKPAYAYLMTLEPLYRYCKERFNIRFTEEQKEFLNGKVKGLFRPEQTRILILKEYPQEDVINAILKFYVKHYILPYGYLMRLSNNPSSLSSEAKREFEEARKKAIEINKIKGSLFKLKTFKQFKKEFKEEHKRFPYLQKLTEKGIKEGYSIMQDVTKHTNKKEYDFVDVLIHKPDFFQQYLEDGFTKYKRELDENPKMVLEVDSNFMKALGIFPF